LNKESYCEPKIIRIIETRIGAFVFSRYQKKTKRQGLYIRKDLQEKNLINMEKLITITTRIVYNKGFIRAAKTTSIAIRYFSKRIEITEKNSSISE
jgi:hypothetical protein